MGTLKPAVSATDHSQGNKNAAITLVEYGDYQCPYCGQAYPIIQEIQEYFGEKLKFVFRNFPLQNIHPFAVPAAIAAESAAKQNKFWEMHDMLFENQANFHGNSFMEFAKELNLDTTQFSNDSKSEAILQRIENDFESGIKSGVNGTPSLYINGLKYNGMVEVQELIGIINSI